MDSGEKRLHIVFDGWVSLPPEILGSIVERLTVRDSFRFAAVCRSWSSAAPPKNNGLYLPRAPQCPYILLRHYRHGFILYGLHEKKFRSLPPFPDILSEIALPSSPGTRFVGAQHGWFILHDDIGNWSLLNPITKARIQLPVLSTSPDRTSMVFITPTPTPNSYAAVVVPYTWKTFFFTRAGDDRWTPLEAEVTKPYGNVAYHNNRFIVVTGDGRVLAIDPTASCVEMTPLAEGPVFGSRSSYLVDSLDDLLLVDRDAYVTGNIEVRRLDFGTGTWVPVRSFGDRSLFLGDIWSMSLSARDVPVLKPNCIYFRDRCYVGEHYGWHVKVYNVEDGNTEIINPSKWLARNSDRDNTMWFMPALR